MFKRLLLIVVGVVILAGCAKPPVKDLEKARRIIAYLHASGAAQFAPDEYRAAELALRKAEQLVDQGASREAREALVLARELSSRALSVTDQRKIIHAEEQRKLAEQEARLAAERKAQEERQQQALIEVKPKPVLPPAPKPEPEPVPEPEPQLVEQIEVSENETLASISARKEVYLDPLLWPLIYKANRDQIKDPQQIFAGQILLIPRDKSKEELDAARQEAKELNLF